MASAEVQINMFMSAIADLVKVSIEVFLTRLEYSQRVYSCIIAVITVLLSFCKYDLVKSYINKKKEQQALDYLFKDYDKKDTLIPIVDVEDIKAFRNFFHNDNTQYMRFETFITEDNKTIEYYRQFTFTYVPIFVYNRSILCILPLPTSQSYNKNNVCLLCERNNLPAAIKLVDSLHLCITPTHLTECFIKAGKLIRDMLPEEEKQNAPCMYNINDTKHVLISNQTFDSLVSKEIRRVHKLIADFMSGEIKRKYNGYAPNNIGILLHGEPGTGKSSLISAVANMTNRNVLLVDLRKLKTAREFSDIINGKFRNHSVNKTIFVFEEIDLFPAVLSREHYTYIEEKKNDDYETHKQILLEGSKNAKDCEEAKKFLEELSKIENEKSDKSSSVLQLDTILTELSGISSSDGRIIIATTNHPEKLDSALKRPGRFDIIAKLTYLDDEEATELATNIFKYDIDKQQLTPKAIKAKTRFTAATFINKAIQYNDYYEFVNDVNSCNG